MEMSLKTLKKMDATQLFYYLLTIKIIPSNSVGQIKKINGLHMSSLPTCDLIIHSDHYHVIITC